MAVQIYATVPTNTVPVGTMNFSTVTGEGSVKTDIFNMGPQAGEV